MIDWVRRQAAQARRAWSPSARWPTTSQAEVPDVEFVRPCNLCPHMKRITLPKILDSLVYMSEEVVIDPADRRAARARGRAHDQPEELSAARSGELAEHARELGPCQRGVDS